MIADVIGWIGNAFFVIGCLLIAYKCPISGCSMNSIGNIFYIVVACMTGLISLIVLSVFLVIINVIGIYNWSKDGQG